MLLGQKNMTNGNPSKLAWYEFLGRFMWPTHRGSGREKVKMSQMTGVQQTHYRGQLQGDNPQVIAFQTQKTMFFFITRTRKKKTRTKTRSKNMTK